MNKRTDLELDCNELFYLFYLVKDWGLGVETWDLNGCWIWIGLPSRRIRGNFSTRISHICYNSTAKYAENA